MEALIAQLAVVNRQLLARSVHCKLWSIHCFALHLIKSARNVNANKQMSCTKLDNPYVYVYLVPSYYDLTG